MLYDELSEQGTIQQIEQQYASTGLSFQEQLDPADAAKAIGISLCEGIKKANGDEQAIRTVFDKTHQTLFKKLRLGQATAVVAQILDNKLIVAGLGDSYALLFKKDGSVAQLSKDSTPDFCIGAENYNKNNGLHVATHNLSQEDDFVILMSDGVIWGEDDPSLILTIEQTKQQNGKRAADIRSNKQHPHNKNPNMDPKVAEVIQEIKQLEKQNRLNRFKQLGDFIREKIKLGKSIPQITQEILATCYQQEIATFNSNKRSSAKMDDASIIIVKLNK